jgi:predicted DNA-binding protein
MSAEEASMKKLMVYLDEEMHEDLRELAHRQKTTMAELVRYALDKTFEDALDIIGAERALEEAARDPRSTMSWEEFKKQLARRDVRAAG